MRKSEAIPAAVLQEFVQTRYLPIQWLNIVFLPQEHERITVGEYTFKDVDWRFAGPDYAACRLLLTNRFDSAYRDKG